MSTYVSNSSGGKNISLGLLCAENSERPTSQRSATVNNVLQSTSNGDKSHPLCAHSLLNDMETKHVPNQSSKRQKNKYPPRDVASRNWNESTNQEKKRTGKGSKNPKRFPLNTPENVPSSSTLFRSQKKERRASSCKEARRNSNIYVRRFNEPVEVSLFDLITASETSKTQKTSVPASKQSVSKPDVHGGKTREVPKPKRPTKLKRAILDERIARKNRRCKSVPDSARICIESEELHESISNSCDSKTGISHMNSAVQMEISPGVSIEKYQSCLVAELLTKLAHFQDRAYTSNLNSPFHQKRAKRFVCGLREVTKHLKLNGVKVVIVARDLEGKAVQNLQRHKAAKFSEKKESEADGDCSSNCSVLENILSKIWDLATQNDHHTPIIIAHTRRHLRKFCNKPSPVSIIGILSFEGALDIAKKLLHLKTAINIPFETNEKSEQQPNEITAEVVPPVLIPISEEKEVEFDMVAKLREAIKQLHFREDKPMPIAQ